MCHFTMRNNDVRITHNVPFAVVLGYGSALLPPLEKKLKTIGLKMKSSCDRIKLLTLLIPPDDVTVSRFILIILHYVIW